MSCSTPGVLKNRSFLFPTRDTGPDCQLSNAHSEGVTYPKEQGGEPMDLRWRDFPVVLVLAAAFVTPVFGQAAPEGGSKGSVPDFSGIWLHTLPGFEPLPSGPTALVNKSRRENGT